MRASRPRDERGQTPLSFDDFPLGVFVSEIEVA